jgi:hypothetical protein
MPAPSLTRRTFVTALTAASGAAGAAPVLAGPPGAAHVAPKRHAPVRAVYNDLPYFDFTGATPPYRPARAKKLDQSKLTPEQRYLLGLF